MIQDLCIHNTDAEAYQISDLGENMVKQSYESKCASVTVATTSSYLAFTIAR